MRGSWFRCWFFVALGLMVAGQFQRFAFFSGTASVYLHEIAFALAGISLVGSSRHSLVSWWKSERLLIQPLIFFLSTLLPSLVIQFFLGHNTIIGWLYLIRLIGYLLLWPMIALAVHQHWVQKKHLQRAVVFLGYAYLFLGLVQYLLVPDTRFLFWLGWDEHAYRAISTLFDPGFSAGLGVLSLALTFPWLVGDDLRKKCLFGAGVVGLLFTYSRAGFVSFLSALVLWGVQTRRASLVASLISVFVMSMFLLPRPESEGAKLERTASVNSRMESISRGLHVQNALEVVFGEGWYLARQNRTTLPGVQRSNASAPDNSIVHVFESAGLLGVSAFLWVLWRMARRVSVRAEYLSALIGVMAGSMFNNLLFYPFLMPALMLLITISGPRAGKGTELVTEGK